MLYNSQVRSLMEYSPLTWSSCPPSYLTLLDKVQQRAQRLVQLKMQGNSPPIHFQPLQKRRDVSGLCVMYKAHKLNTPHLSALRLQQAASPTHNTRTSHSRSSELQVPFARTEQYKRTFLPKYSRLWNNMVQQTTYHNIESLQLFKSQIHRWLQTT